MRAAQLHALATVFVGSSLLALIGCGGDSGSQPPTGGNGQVPAILVAPTQVATLQDGGTMLLRVLPSATGGVEGQALIFPPEGTPKSDRPVLLSVKGTSMDMNLVELSEQNKLVDYRLVGTTASNGIFNANLLAGPDASPGDEPPQALGFARATRSKNNPLKPGRATGFATSIMRILDGPNAFRYRFNPATLVDDSFGLTYDIGYRLCLECTDKFTDYSPVYAQYFDDIPNYITVFFRDKDGETGWGTIDRRDGKFIIDGGDPENTFFVERSPVTSDVEFGRLVDVVGSVVLFE